MEHSDYINELAAALAAAQAQIKPAALNSVNPFLKNRYADLGAVIEASRKPLADNGLAVTQLMGGDGATVTVETMLLHKSGQWIKSTASLPVGEERGKSLAQAMGSVVTYLRRYALAAILGIYADEDTDGNEPAKPQPKPQPKAQPEKIMQDLGYDTPAPSATMSLETALNTLDSKGQRYGDKETALLVNMLNAIQKKLDSDGYGPEEREEKLYKRDVIRVIMAERNGK